MPFCHDRISVLEISTSVLLGESRLLPESNKEKSASKDGEYIT